MEDHAFNELKDKNLLESARDLLTKLKIKAGKLGDLGIEIEDILRKDAEIDVYENNLSKICEAGYKITWIVDDLDLGWNNSEVANNLLLGLLTCSNYIKNISNNLHIFFFWQIIVVLRLFAVLNWSIIQKGIYEPKSNNRALGDIITIFNIN